MLSRSAHADARHSAWMRDAEDTTAVHASRLPIDDLVVCSRQLNAPTLHAMSSQTPVLSIVTFHRSIVLSRTL